VLGGKTRAHGLANLRQAAHAPGMNSVLGPFIALCLLIVYISVFIFVITLLWRIASALEKMARMQVEMARDIKQIAQATLKQQPEEPEHD
jgi:hypothetical protein